MSTPRRTSQLRKSILLSLLKRNAPSISALAVSLKQHRPSVSRAINALEQEQLLVRDGRNVRLTEAGREVAVRLSETISGAQPATVHRVARMLENQAKHAQLVGVPSPVDALLQEQILRATFGTNDIFVNALLLAQEQDQIFQRAVQASPFSSTLDQLMREAQEREHVLHQAIRPPPYIEEALVSAARLQERLASLVSPTSPFGNLLGLDRVLADSNLFAAQIRADMTVLRMVDTTTLDDTLSELHRATAGSVRAFDRYSAETVSELSEMLRSSPQAAPETSRLVAYLELPTFATNRIVHSARRVIAPEESTVRAEEQPLTVEAVIQPYGARFAALWDGAWLVETKDDFGSRIQSAHSARELLDQTLHELAPNSSFTKEERERLGGGKITRAMRILHIVGEKNTEYESLSNSVDAMISLLTAEAHTRKNEPRLARESHVGVLNAVGGLILWLHGAARKRTSQ